MVPALLTFPPKMIETAGVTNPAVQNKTNEDMELDLELELDAGTPRFHSTCLRAPLIFNNFQVRVGEHAELGRSSHNLEQRDIYIDLMFECLKDMWLRKRYNAEVQGKTRNVTKHALLIGGYWKRIGFCQFAGHLPRHGPTDTPWFAFECGRSLLFHAITVESTATSGCFGVV